MVEADIQNESAENLAFAPLQRLWTSCCDQHDTCYALAGRFR